MPERAKIVKVGRSRGARTRGRLLRVSYGEPSFPRRALHRLHHFASQPSQALPESAIRRAAFVAWMTLNVAAHPNSAGHRMRAAANLWAWQIWRRTKATPVLVELPCGARIRCPAWSKMAGVWVSIGYHEEELLFLLSVLQPDEVFVDVGANIGVYSMVASACGARVVAFEPVATARAAFEENVRLNRAEATTRVHPVALSDEPGKMKITNDLESSNHLVVGEGEGTWVDVCRLDDVLEADKPRSRIGVIKVDAEGFDANVLRGAQSTLSRYRPAVIVEVWAGGRDVRAVLEPLGYKMFHFVAPRQTLESIDDDFAQEGYFVAVHLDEIDRITSRLAKARTPDLAPRVRWHE